MKATKLWGPCQCNCGEQINAGTEFTIVDGAMYLTGHEINRRTRQMPVFKGGKMQTRGPASGEELDLFAGD